MCQTHHHRLGPGQGQNHPGETTRRPKRSRRKLRLVGIRHQPVELLAGPLEDPELGLGELARFEQLAEVPIEVPQDQGRLTAPVNVDTPTHRPSIAQGTKTKNR